MWLSVFDVVTPLLLLLLAFAGDIEAQNDYSHRATSTDPKDGKQTAQNSVPVVDLGYSIYRPTALNAKAQYYNFSNIRYAAPPLGDLRWRDPQPPLVERSRVNDGTLGYVCPQSAPLWFTVGNKALGNLAAYIPPGISGQQENEDCLFLDVISPVKVFQQRQKRRGKLAPVLLAAFGFLSHLKPSQANYTSPNAGLLDQRFALKWVKEYIHLFGGDRNQVTILGESAGGGSVQYHTVAYGGAKENDLFIRGISQSPAPLTSDPKYPRLGANLFLELAGVRSVDEARKLPSQLLRNANVKAQAETPFNVAYFAPTVDGDLLPDIIPRLYNQGNFNKNLAIIASHNENESRFLGNQSINTNEDFNNWVETNFPSTSPELRDYIINDLYPPKYDGSLPYNSPQQRNDLATKEYLISCNADSIARAYNYKGYNYLFSVPPAIHAQDLAYTYYPNGATPGFYPDIATTLQGYLAKFVLTGDPNGYGLPDWPNFTEGAKVIDFVPSGVKQTTSETANERCKFWSQGTYYPLRR
ncbi:MAG: hypothetical protein Q9217_005051 [Psora testacea]